MMIRLGVAARTLGNGTRSLPAAQAGQEIAYLSTRLLALRDTVLYLARHTVRCYRLPDSLLPLGRAIGPQAWFAAMHACAEIGQEIGALARQHTIRLTLHPGLHVNLAAQGEEAAAHAVCQVEGYAALLDLLGCDAESVIVLHVGGAQDVEQQALRRFAQRFAQLTPRAQARVAVEADQNQHDVAALLWLWRRCGTPIIFDSLHFQLHNPHRMHLAEALQLACSSWPGHIRPKVHFSSQRTEAHIHEARGEPMRILPPRRGQHADFLNPFEFIALLQAAQGLPGFDIMIEAKAADLAVLRLRDDLAVYAPAFARWVC